MTYDYIIVGAGSAGAIIASRISEDPSKSVLLLEAGSDYPDFESLPDVFKYGFGPAKDWPRDFGWWTNPGNLKRWFFEAEATEEQTEVMMIPRGKVTGGSSTVNAQIFLRGDPDDYDTWAKNGNDQWSFDNCLPAFIRLENDTDESGDFHGTGGPIQVRRHPKSEWTQDANAFHQGFQETGFPATSDHNDPDSTGVGPIPFNTIDQVRQSTALGYINPARNRLNFTLRSDCTVHQIIFEGNKAVGVEIESGNENFKVYGNEIILSGGSIGSPHLLLLSGIGPADNLNEVGIPILKNLPGVGQNLRDHPQVSVSWNVKDSYEHDREGTNRVVTVGLRYTSDGSNHSNDIFIHQTSVIFPDMYFGGDINQMSTGVAMSACLYLAKGSGELKLRSSDPTQQPYLNYNYFREEEDLRRMRESVRLCAKVGDGNSYKHIVSNRIQPTDEQLNDNETLNLWLKQNATTSHHITSTCKMGPSTDSMAVVDQFGKVYGIDGLRIGDASIMPNCVRANTNVPSMMVGEKIAEFIKQGK